MRISDWSSDVCSSDLFLAADHGTAELGLDLRLLGRARDVDGDGDGDLGVQSDAEFVEAERLDRPIHVDLAPGDGEPGRGDGLGKVAGPARAVELAGVAGAADDRPGVGGQASAPLPTLQAATPVVHPA